MSDHWRDAAMLFAQLPQDRNEALEVLRCTRSLVECIHSLSMGETGRVVQLAQARGGDPGQRPSFSAIAGDSLVASPNNIQSADKPAKT